MADTERKRNRRSSQQKQRKTLYRIVRGLTGSGSNTNTPIRNKNGKLLLTKEEQDARWIEHFEKTPNQPNPTTTFDFSTFAAAKEVEATLDMITEAEEKTRLS